MMQALAYINGKIMPKEEAMISIEDRGYHFADGVYEYIAYYDQKLLDGGPHLDRLERSLAEINIPMPCTRQQIEADIAEMIAQAEQAHGAIYMQVTRGVAKRDHPFPNDAAPLFTMLTYPSKLPSVEKVQAGVSVISCADERWSRCDIKSISLLPNILARQKAEEAGCREAWMIRDGVITEGSASNAYIIKGGVLITHPKNNHILSGIVREVTLKLARETMPVKEEAFTLQEAMEADEAFMTSTSANILPVVEVDGKAIGNGKAGEHTMQLLGLYHTHVEAQTGFRC
jgi:D-alanine transaminase